MSIVYTWSFPQFEVAPSEDGLVQVVKTIHWRLDAIDAGVSAGVYGSVALAAPNPDAYTPFDEITEEWAIAATSSLIELDQVQSTLAGEIDKKKNPPVVPMQPPFG